MSNLKLHMDDINKKQKTSMPRRIQKSTFNNEKSILAANQMIQLLHDSCPFLLRKRIIQVAAVNWFSSLLTDIIV